MVTGGSAVIQHDCLVDAFHGGPLPAAVHLTVYRWRDVVKSFRASVRLML